MDTFIKDCNTLDELCDKLGWSKAHYPAMLCGWIDENGDRMLSNPLEDLNCARRAEQLAFKIESYDDEKFIITLCGMTNGYAHRATARQRIEALLSAL